MDGIRFDALTKSIITGTSRRQTLGVLLGGTLGLMSLADADEAWSASSGKCKPKCDACEQCDKGKCDKKNGKKHCKKGKCKPLKGLVDCSAGQVRNLVTCGCCSSNGQPCSSPGSNNSCCSEVCVPVGMSNNVCVGRPVGTACQFDAQCGNGSCNNGACN